MLLKYKLKYFMFAVEINFEQPSGIGVFVNCIELCEAS